MFLEDSFGFIHGRIDWCGYQAWKRSHQVTNQAFGIGLESDVTVRENTAELAIVHDRETSHIVLFFQLEDG